MGAIPEADPDEPMETKPFKFVTAGYDARFPQQNQTKHCWQNYVDYHKCINETIYIAKQYCKLYIVPQHQ